MKPFLQAVAALLLPAAAAAQTAEVPPVLTEAQEVALARSAAPANVSSDATILILRDDKYVPAHEGSNGVTCMVSRSLPLAIEPICYDPEASRTILQMEIQRVEQRLAGVPAEEVERQIEESIGSGAFAVPQRPAMAYMLSAGQILYADAETKVGAFYPHLHIFMPYATAAQLGGLGGGPTTSPGLVFDEGKPTANLVVFARDFVEPEDTDKR
jgi:hypothetical protein